MQRAVQQRSRALTLSEPNSEKSEDEERETYYEKLHKVMADLRQLDSKLKGPTASGPGRPGSRSLRPQARVQATRARARARAFGQSSRVRNFVSAGLQARGPISNPSE